MANKVIIVIVLPTSWLKMQHQQTILPQDAMRQVSVQMYIIMLQINCHIVIMNKLSSFWSSKLILITTSFSLLSYSKCHFQHYHHHHQHYCSILFGLKFLCSSVLIITLYHLLYANLQKN